MKSPSLKELLEMINKDTFYDLYITQNLSLNEIAVKYNTTNKMLSKLNCAYYQIKKPKDLAAQLNIRISMEKYGVEHPQTLEAVKQKSKNTCIERYGVKNAGWTPESQKKIYETNMKKYGCKNGAQAEQVKNKIKQTLLEHYGVEHALQNDSIKQKMKATTLEHYGETSALKNKDFLKQYKATNLEKYGSEFPMLSDSANQKRKNTCLKKYGTEYAVQSQEVRNRINNTIMQKYNTRSTLSLTDVQDKIKNTVIEKYGVEYYCLTEKCRKASNGPHSKPNVEFTKLLEDAKIDFETEFNIKNKSYDFKINNILIEVDPTYTHQSTIPFRNSKTILSSDYHKNKSDLAAENGYHCIHVFDWDDPQKIINLISNKTTIAARNCKIGELTDDKNYQKFLNENHIQGYCKGQKIILGLYYKNELIEIMSFGKPRYNKNYEYELLRLCTKAGYQVIGGAQKLFQYFIRIYDPKSIISYCDNAKFSGEVYKKLGFELKDSGHESKHWYNMKTKDHITDNLLRQRGFDQLFKTEYGKGTSNEELMKEYGYVEVYDCGQSTWIYKKAE